MRISDLISDVCSPDLVAWEQATGGAGSLPGHRYPRRSMPSDPLPVVERRPRTAAGRARRAHERLALEYPGDAVELCALKHTNAYELLAATILSAQTTDERVNMVTPQLFARSPAPADLAGAEAAAPEATVRSPGLYKNKQN